MKQLAFISIVFFMFISCQSQMECCISPTGENEQALYGRYQVIEYGYSPGAGYIVEPVAAEPLQYVDFLSGGRFSSNYQGFESFNYYTIATDTAAGSTLILSLYKDEPSVKSGEANYSVDFAGEKVKLNYRFCIEGCHVGIKKINQAPK